MTELPEGWSRRRLGDTLERLIDHRGQTPGKLGGKFQDHGVPVISAIHIKGGRVDFSRRERFVSQEMFERWMPERLRSGDVLLTSEAPMGSVALVPSDAPLVLSQRLFALRGRTSLLDNRYLRWALEAQPIRDQLDRRSSGSTVTGIRQSELVQVELPLPPLPEQRRLVEILEDHLSGLDAAQGSLTRAASACAVLNLSVLSDIRGSLLHSSVKLEPLGEVCETALGKMLDAKKASGTPTPYLGNINVRWGGFDLSGLKTVPLSDAERARFEVKAGDLLVCEGGEPGRCAVWVDGATGITYQKALHRVRAKDPSRVAPDFVALLLEEFIRMGRADGMFTGTTIRHLPQEKLRAIELPIPNLQTQRATVDRVTAHVQATSRLGHEVRRVASEGAALRRALLGAAFSGRLTGRSTDMEMVEEMAGV